MTEKDVARERLEALRASLIELSHRIHSHPEVGFEEQRASTWIAEFLRAAGLEVESGVCGLPTAFDSLPAVNHQPEFAAHCVTPAADKAVVDGALAMAWTAIDLAKDASLRERLLGAPAQ